MGQEPITFGIFRGEEHTVPVAEGEVVFSAGDPGDRLYVVRSGSVALRLGDRDVERLGPGEMFGEMALIDGSPRSATAVAVEDGVLVVVDEARFQRLIRDTPFFAQNVMRLIAARLRRATAPA